jgi:CRP/FNR family transcriptional regulator/CRP/FNR family cyclic AMP-dependent transcriptional regulator
MTEDNHKKALIEKFLKNVPVFKNLSKGNLERIINDFSILHTRKGDTVFFQTDRSTELYIILKGKARVSLMGEAGNEFILNELHEGEFFGELSLIDGKARSATVVAVSDSTFGVLKRERFLNAIKLDPMIAIHLLETLVERLRKATDREERFAFLDVRNRLVKLIIQLVKTEAGSEINGSFSIKKRTHKELASRIGASREAISKVLKDLINKNLIKEEEGYYFVSTKFLEDTDSISKDTLM